MMAKKLSVADRLSELLTDYPSRYDVHIALKVIGIVCSVASMRTADSRGCGIGVFRIFNSTAYYTKDAVLVWAKRKYPDWLTPRITRIQLA